MKEKTKEKAALPEIVYIPASKLKLNPNNPRQIGKKEFERLVKSLQDAPEMFNARPLLVSQRTGANIVIGGNMRFRAAQKLGYKEIPCIVLDGITEEKEREIAIKDNGAFGEWDWDALANQWGDLPLAEWGILVSEKWVGPVDEVPPPELSETDQPCFQGMTFILHNDQIETVKMAIKKAIENGGGKSKINNNKNGSALFYISKKYLNV
jgi:hypothetical protein